VSDLIRLIDKLQLHLTGRTQFIGNERTFPASITSMTSSCVISAPGFTPGAWFVTHANPTASMPSADAAISSGAVDMLTTSPPRVRTIRTSAGVS
jgi:hypothetical protein